MQRSIVLDLTCASVNTMH